MFSKLQDCSRLLMDAEFAPVQGDRFQPTGFADLGAATYSLPDGTRMLLVESAQSMANRLEAALLNSDNELIHELRGLPYVKVTLKGATEAVTNSLIEAHRINSPFIIVDESFQAKFKEAAQYKKHMPLNWKNIAAALLRYDVNSLLHGVFLANLDDGRIKVPRALSAFIEATGVREAVSGGVKNNPIDPSGKIRAEKYDKNVYGNVPYQRVEYTADRMTAYFNLDLGLLRSYRLGNDAHDLLIALALYKIRIFLKEGTRLRTACDLKMRGGINVTEPEGFEIPEKGQLLNFLQQKIVACKGVFADPPVTEIETTVVLKGSTTEDQGETQPDEPL